jgi:epidermal growth factor receptor substrate 15
MQTQLSSAKAAYESESKHLATLRERFSVQAAEIQKARHELITAESDVSGMRAEKAEIEGGLLRDKEEVRALQRRMKEVGTEIDVLKLEAEKARKDAKQQKGLLAIAKKQLSQREAERAKVEKELEEANLENAATTQEREAAEAELAKELPAPVHTASPPAASSPPPIAMNGHADTLDLATAQPLPLSPEPTGVPVAATISPMHTGKSNNPFDRLAGSAAGSPRTQSPFLPFTATNVPTPVGQDQQPVSTAEMDDPFGFSQPEHDTAQQPEPEGALFEPVVTNIAAEPQAATPRAAPAELSVATEAVSPHSPTNTDFFQTPPSTAVPSVHTQSPKHSMAPAEIAAEAASRGEPRSIPGGFPGHEDSMSPLQEKVIDESDSEDEDEDDEVPLAALADKGKGKRPTEEVAPAAEPISPSAQEISASTFDDAFGDGAATPKVATPRVSTANAPPVPSLSAFDNAFESVAAAAPPVASTNVFGNAFEPAPVAAPVEQPKAAPVNGLNEFDEAMGKIGGQTTGTSAPFSFDTAFDDNFDFSSATDGGAASHPAAEAVKAPQATPAPATNGFNGVLAAPVSAAAPIPAAAPVSAAPPGLPPVSQQSFSFDDVFSSSVAAPQAPPAALQHTPSFDDAFGFTPASPTGDQAAPASSKMSAISQFQAPPGQHPSIATPSSPIRGSSASSMTRSPSPPSRTTSPPPRHQSPRPRASESTSSIHEKPEKDKKSSRLSVSVVVTECRHELITRQRLDPPALWQEEEGQGPADAVGVHPRAAGRGASRRLDACGRGRHREREDDLCDGL